MQHSRKLVNMNSLKSFHSRKFMLVACPNNQLTKINQIFEISKISSKFYSSVGLRQTNSFLKDRPMNCRSYLSNLNWLEISRYLTNYPIAFYSATNPTWGTTAFPITRCYIARTHFSRKL